MKQTSILHNFHNVDIFVLNGLETKWTKQLLNVRANVVFQILSYHFMLDRVEKVYGISLEVFSSWSFQSCLSMKKQMKNKFFLLSFETNKHSTQFSQLWYFCAQWTWSKVDQAAHKCTSECCISDLELSFYARQSWKGIWYQFRDIFKLDFPILPLGEETDEERVF